MLPGEVYLLCMGVRVGVAVGVAWGSVLTLYGSESGCGCPPAG